MYPVIAKLGAFTIYSYGACMLVGIVLGLQVMKRLARREGLDFERIKLLALIIVAVGYFGTEVLHALANFSDLLLNPRNYLALKGGLAWYGGPLLAFPVSLILIRFLKLPFAKTADIFAPGLALGHGIGRIGCFLAGCCYGNPTTLPWGVKFVAGVAAAAHSSAHLHPTQLYEAAAEFLTFMFLVWFYRRKSFDGQLFALYFLIYSVARFTIEFFRGDDDRGNLVFNALSTSQGISVIIFVASFANIVYCLRLGAKQLFPAK